MYLSLKALSRMREYERLRTEGKLTELVSGVALLKGDKHVKDDVTTSSAGDVGSESSISDVQVSPVSTLSQKYQFFCFIKLFSMSYVAQVRSLPSNNNCAGRYGKFVSIDPTLRFTSATCQFGVCRGNVVYR